MLFLAELVGWGWGGVLLGGTRSSLVLILHRLALGAFLQGRAWAVLQVDLVVLLTVVQGVVGMGLLGDS